MSILGMTIVVLLNILVSWKMVLSCNLRNRYLLDNML